jgi:hypothetical protein
MAAIGGAALLAFYALLLQFDALPHWMGEVNKTAPRSCGGHHQGPGKLCIRTAFSTKFRTLSVNPSFFSVRL